MPNNHFGNTDIIVVNNLKTIISMTVVAPLLYTVCKEQLSLYGKRLTSFS